MLPSVSTLALVAVKLRLLDALLLMVTRLGVQTCLLLFHGVPQTGEAAVEAGAANGRDPVSGCTGAPDARRGL